MRRIARILSACLVAAGALAVVLTHDPMRHQAAITVVCLPAVGLAIRGAFRDRTGAAAALAAGVTLWTAGSATQVAVFAFAPAASYPAPPEIFWLAAYPALWLALALTLGARTTNHHAGAWLDGLVGCLGVAAVGSTFILPRLAPMHLSPLGMGVMTAFPIGDLLLIGIAGSALLLARDGGRIWWLLALGALGVAVPDLLFALRIVGGLDLYSSAFDVAWPLGLLALACVEGAGKTIGPRRDLVQSRGPIMPALFSAAALAILVTDHYHRIAEAGLWLAVATIALGVARTVEGARTGAALREAERLALTDDLTRVGNRRRLFRDLADALERGEPRHLTLFDLDGFKAHNDTHGHAAGDRLLAELGERLSDAVAGAGTAYRLGGDEFCVVLSDETAMQRVEAAFRAGASRGSVSLPHEAGDTTQALRIADARMYADKASRTRT